MPTTMYPKAALSNAEGICRYHYAPIQDQQPVTIPTMKSAAAKVAKVTATH